MIEFENKSTPESEKVVRPNIVIHPSLEKPDLPYSVEVDADGIAAFLKDAGVGDDKIAKTNIKVKRKARYNPFFFTGGKIAGSYSPLTEDLTIYTDWVWERYERAMQASERIANNRPIPFFDERLLKKRVATNRLPGYLTEAPKDRGLEFASKLIWTAQQRKMDSVILHELGHKRDHEWPPNIKLLVPGYGMKAASVMAIYESYKRVVEGSIPSAPNDWTDLVLKNAVFLAYTLSLLRVEYKFDLLEVSARRYDSNFDGNRPRFVKIIKK